MPAAESRSPPLVVYKLGGSLLDLPDLGEILRQVMAQRQVSAGLIVVGGGAAADAVRTWDRVHHLGDERAHRLALRAMALNERLIHELLPESRLVRSPRQVRAAAAESAIGVLCADCFYRWAETNAVGRVADPPASPSGSATRTTFLPCSWKVTSDSIAAWVAAILQAHELVLLKSVDMPGESVAESARRGLVDEHFPTVAAHLARISWLNARVHPPVIRLWRGA
ncbi:MAG: amino acid kinase family protein [Planctomycetaceae bacterium]